MSKKALINISNNAWYKMNNIIKSQNAKGFLFSAVSGGCNGLNYNLELIKDQTQIDKITSEKIKYTKIENNDVKFYIDASLKVRAKRRWNDLIVNEKNISLNDVANDLFNRDKIDVNRKISPLIVPNDSIKINTDNFTIDQVVHKMIKLIDKKIKK